MGILLRFNRQRPSFVIGQPVAQVTGGAATVLCGEFRTVEVSARGYSARDDEKKRPGSPLCASHGAG
jgi:hypothetical protein